MIQIYSNTLITCSAPRDTQRDEHESVWSRFTVTLWSRVQHERHTERRARVCMIQIYSNALITCSALRDTQRDEHESVWSRFTVTLWSVFSTERHTERRARVCMIQIYSNTLITCSAPRDTQRDEHESVWSRFTVTLWSRVQHWETHRERRARVCMIQIYSNALITCSALRDTQRETSTSLYDPDLQ